MKSKNIIVVVFIILIASAGWFFLSKNHPPLMDDQAHKDIYYCPMHPHYTSDRPGNCPICGMKLVKKEMGSESALGQQIAQPAKRKILYYRNPMNPSVTSPTFMKDSMGMDYIPVYSEAVPGGDEEAQTPSGPKGYAAISASLQKQQLIGLKTMTVNRTNAVKTIRAAGHVTTNHDLYMFQDEYIQAYTQYVKTYRDYRRVEHLRRTWETHRDLQMKLHEAQDKLLQLGLSPDQIDQLRNVSWQTPWKQPELLFLKDHFEYWIVAQILEGDLGYVEVGQGAQIFIPGYKEKAKGIVRSVGGIVDPDTRTTNAFIELKDYRGELKGNMFVNVEISAALGDVIMVPRDAVMDTGVRKIVFVQKGEGTFEPREIQTGWETDDGFEAISGLNPGDHIVTNGNFLLDSESRVQAGLEEGK